MQYIKNRKHYLSQEPENIPTLGTSNLQQFSLVQDSADEVINILKKELSQNGYNL